VVELGGRAGGLVVDSGAVELEGRLRGINGNGDGSEGNGNLEGGLILLGDDVSVGSDPGSAVGSVVLAGVGSRGGVGVRSLSVDSLVGNDVLEGVVHKTSTASVVSVGDGAIDEVLLRERNQSASGQEVASLSRSGGGEGPAGSALSLVLNGSDGSLGDPVDTDGEGCGVLDNLRSSLRDAVGGDLQTSVGLGKFG